MRKALLVAAAFLLAAGNMFAGCAQPHLMIPGIPSDASCVDPGDPILFTSASIGKGNVTVIKQIDQSSAHFFLAAATGKHFASAVLNIPSQQKKYTFVDVLISSVQHSVSASSTVETVVFVFSSYTTSPATRLNVFTSDIAIAGSVQPFGSSVLFMAEPATGWQLTVQRSADGLATLNAVVQRIVKTTVSSTVERSLTPILGCTELLRADGTPFAKYVFQAVVPPDGGISNITKMQVQVPPSPGCAFTSSGGGWNLAGNTAV